MTMIAFHATEKSAHLMTDSINYTTYCEVLGQSTKRTPLDHLDATIATQGKTVWGNTVAASLVQLSGEVPTFAELVDYAPQIARGCRDSLEQQHPGERVGEGFVVLLGYDHRLERFAGYILHSLNDYEAKLHDGLFVTPMPWIGQPTDEQVRSLIDWGEGDENTREAAELWKAKPRLDAPQSDDDWLELAITVREQRAMETFAHVLVAGSVYLTKIKRGWQGTRKIHQFNDNGEELLHLLRGTRHPLALAGPCACGSGVVAAECHEKDKAEQPVA